MVDSHHSSGGDYVRNTALVLVCLLLLVAVGAAYNQCLPKPCGKQDCPSACPDTCPCPSCADCPHRGTCLRCEACPSKGCAVSTASGTVRYVRVTGSAVKVVNGGNGLLLRVNPKCAAASAIKQKLLTLKKGDAVTAKYWVDANSGKSYLVDISQAVTATPTSAGAAPGSCSPNPSCASTAPCGAK